MRRPRPAERSSAGRAALLMNAWDPRRYGAFHVKPPIGSCGRRGEGMFNAAAPGPPTAPGARNAGGSAQSTARYMQTPA